MEASQKGHKYTVIHHSTVPSSNLKRYCSNNTILHSCSKKTTIRVCDKLDDVVSCNENICYTVQHLGTTETWKHWALTRKMCCRAGHRLNYSVSFGDRKIEMTVCVLFENTAAKKSKDYGSQSFSIIKHR